MKRKSRRAKNQKVSPINDDLELIEPDAAAVDVGSRSHWVAVNPQRDASVAGTQRPPGRPTRCGNLELSLLI